MTRPTVTALIVAAGRGTRAGGGMPKQFRDLAGRPVLTRSVVAFDGLVDAVVVVVDEAYREMATSMAPDTRLVLGGATRAASVAAGLEAVETDFVLIHDAARPGVPREVIGCVIAALGDAPAAAPALPVTDALWVGDGLVTGLRDRAGLWRAQTPQGFRTQDIRAAHAAFAGEAADDVEVARAAGLDVAIVTGDEDAMKITTAGDFARAARLFEGRREMDVRLGNGFDVHRFGPGDHVVLCGVRVPHDRGLQGHSDADVGLHAIADAIYGALAEGDIGCHFPPSDPQWKEADSAVFLAHAADLARTRGFAIGNVDATLICERPKIGPHAAEMRDRVAAIAGLDAGRVSVKATTTERLGFAGRAEGIACMSTVALVSA
ncbi:bifunctional 2-C-methyl-D-erythritol 4-phosphate cytidylyltransferase/2-C-methyl-D-erythritol 2,4-cyclodiphosphate synthase [Jannaschia sp. S6380]|uniref:bifunctional 2-C-methyl-D-erythritol 4-phosphate cytidylyltransferase/2-C-methyl-D-erythritol 2,4-cyclodiphosphate synthase n=1 Tax=Jannaschia sp. S6380 TaxID=2926408 RepID=UPI001FF5528F|nr:bifunctional 2-C-methyl-D-erythritol 4-phosphate cytidylyltransferase/2-C-methyl-D-erythritol 2,4-cyclodiphosphate synthase [Jannaschia sp. S6380]MCK0166587.1 bifunctional 2-C-methyl-D-erythritol 4-phosphate cytidylyltransferase/2-C-methyl-D-erythritol 2,4-cyclodiphosphate synthase [Jannaschia sp. S6380]